MFLSLFQLININKPIQNIVCNRRAVQFNIHLSTKKYMKSLTFGNKFCLMCPSSVCQKKNGTLIFVTSGDIIERHHVCHNGVLSNSDTMRG